MHEVIETDFVPLRAEIRTKYDEGEVKAVMLHDGSTVRLRKTDPDYDPSNRRAVLDYLGATAARGEVATGLLYIEGTNEDMHSFENTVERPLVDVAVRCSVPRVSCSRRDSGGVAIMSIRLWGAIFPAS